MVIIKCNALLDDEQRRKLEINIHDQAADGVIVLPNFCELLNEVPADEDIKVQMAPTTPNDCIKISRFPDHTCLNCGYFRNKDLPDRCKDGVPCDKCTEQCPCRNCMDFSNWRPIGGAHG